MREKNIPGRNGYDIPCLFNLAGGEKLTVIISHGFGSSKLSPTAQAVLAALPGYGIGACAFDFPAHGESPAPGGALRISNCLDDLATVEACLLRQNPDSEIAYLSSSFGAYINLIYLSAREHAGCKSFLRCTAVDMAGIIRRGITPEFRAALEQNGFFIMDEGYVRPLKITEEFLAELDEHDLFRLCRPGMAELAMIHGAADETAPISDARRFARFVGADLTEVEGADHRFQIPGGIDLIVEKAAEFFTRASGGGEIRIRKLTPAGIPEALRLVWNVFLEEVAPDYCEQGVRTFRNFLGSEEIIGGLTVYGAYSGNTLAGVAATGSDGNHLSLFFTDSRFQRRGVGRKLFETVLRSSASGSLTVNSSPYAAGFYRRLGFADAGPEQLKNGIRYIPMKYMSDLRGEKI